MGVHEKTAWLNYEEVEGSQRAREKSEGISLFEPKMRGDL
jgi:hypothetical protein